MVMTDQQLETLRRQICVYSTICTQLVQMHTAMASLPRQEMLYDPATITPGLRMSARQRWTPSQTQLKILERLYEQSNGPPSKQKIKELTIELSQHGLISETNVYNWFQNRRARTKRKQQIGLPNNEESEMDNSLDLSREKKAKFDKNTVQETPVLRERSVSVQSQGVSDQHNFNSQHHESAIPFCTQVGSKALVGLSRNTSFEHGFSATRNGQSLEAMEKLNSLSAGEGYIMMQFNVWINSTLRVKRAIDGHTDWETLSGQFHCSSRN